MDETMVRASFEAQGAMRLIGATMDEAASGRAVLSMPFRNDLAQQDGFFHAGILTTLADSAGGYAAYSMMPDGARVLAVEFKVNFVRPAQGDRAIATGTVVKAGRTLTVCDLEVHVQQGDTRVLVAKGLQTCMCLPGAATPA